MKNFSLFLALRYLKPKRTYVSVITLISILGVMLGITVLILVISVMTGFDRELRRKVIGFEAHLVVASDEVIGDYESTMEQVNKTPLVVASAPFVMGPVIVEFGNRRMAPKIRGIDPDLEKEVTDIGSFIISGDKTMNLDGEYAILGSEVARNLGVGVGDMITIYSPGSLGEILKELNKVEEQGTDEGAPSMNDLRELVLPAELEVTGIFESGRYLYDSEFLLVPLHVGKELYGLTDSVHGIAIKTKDPYQAERVKNDLLAVLPPTLMVHTWIDLNRQFFDAITMERQVMFFLLFFIVIVAAFGIMNTLITVTVQKTREIGIMKALGANTSQVVWVFLAQGMVVGFFGTLSGLVMGSTLIRFRNEVSQFLATALRVEVFPASVYQFAEIPAEVVPKDVAIICISAFLICSLAALIPAYFAARLDPVKALRYD